MHDRSGCHAPAIARQQAEIGLPAMGPRLEQGTSDRPPENRPDIAVGEQCHVARGAPCAAPWSCGQQPICHGRGGLHRTEDIVAAASAEIGIRSRLSRQRKNAAIARLCERPGDWSRHMGGIRACDVDVAHILDRLGQ